VERQEKRGEGRRSGSIFYLFSSPTRIAIKKGVWMEIRDGCKEKEGTDNVYNPIVLWCPNHIVNEGRAYTVQEALTIYNVILGNQECLQPHPDGRQFIPYLGVVYQAE
jgi:hypothetical protein